jgi:hypothetical protein
VEENAEQKRIEDLEWMLYETCSKVQVFAHAVGTNLPDLLPKRAVEWYRLEKSRRAERAKDAETREEYRKIRERRMAEMTPVQRVAFEDALGR